MSRWLPRIDAGGGGVPVPPPGGDHFAPEWIVGNTVAGDPAIANLAPFRYLGDPGDGSAIATALAEAAATGNGAWVHIRRGVYDLNLAGSPALPLSVPGLKVTGAGDSTIIRQNTLDRRVFLLTQDPAGAAGRPAEMRDLRIDYTVAAAGASGASLIDLSTTNRAVLENIDVIKESGVPALNANESLTSIYRVAGTGSRLVCCRGINIDGTAGLTVAIFRVSGLLCAIDMCASVGANIGYRWDGNNGSIDGSTHSGAQLTASSNGFELDGINVRVNGSSATSVVDAYVAEGGSAIVVGNAIGTASGDGIRIEAAASECVITGNRLNGNPLVDAGAGTVIGHNAL